MPTEVENPPIAESLSGAASMLLKMGKKEFQDFEPRNTFEGVAHSLCASSLRGDVAAFRELYNAADHAELFTDAVENIDGLSRSLMHLAEQMNTEMSPETYA